MKFCAPGQNCTKRNEHKINKMMMMMLMIKSEAMKEIWISKKHKKNIFFSYICIHNISENGNEKLTHISDTESHYFNAGFYEKKVKCKFNFNS